MIHFVVISKFMLKTGLKFFVPKQQIVLIMYFVFYLTGPKFMTEPFLHVIKLA